MKRLLSVLSIAVISIIILGSCSSRNYLTLTVTEPAPVTVSSKINNIGIINRSNVGMKNQRLDKIDKIISLEGQNLDKDGAKSCVIGLFDEMVANNRFAGVKIIDTLKGENPGMGIYPAPLTWEKIDQICRANQVDAVFELSSYDTDSKVSYSVTTKNVGALGVSVAVPEHHATITTLIKTGWRIYDPLNKIILDEYMMNESISSSGSGINPMVAVEAILGRKEAAIQMSHKIGQNYAYRIFPYNIRVAREYYVRGTDNFKIAKRRAQTGNWDGAAELWAKEVNNPKGKIAGRACYNMAIINEINGNLDKAIEWASKSYTDYENKYALYYLNTLKYRVNQKNVLQNQTK
jgi:hypothetical protein